MSPLLDQFGPNQELLAVGEGDELFNLWRKTMRRRIRLLTCLAVTVIATTALGSLFTWTGSGGNDLWSNHDNWDHPGGCLSCWPDDATDDAKIPTNGSTWAIDLITETIDDLTIEDDVTFGDGGLDAVLTTESVAINGPAVVTVSEGVTILATASP